MSRLRARSRRFSVAFMLPLSVAFGIASSSESAIAATYTWTSPTVSGLWSGTGNWTPNSVAGGPTSTTADTVLLDTTASDTSRTVSIDSAANAGITTLTLAQTNSGTNELSINRNFSVTNATVLGALNGGVSRIVVIPATTSANVTSTFTGGISLESGGVLALGAFSGTTTTVRLGNLSGNVTVQGGSLIVDQVAKGTPAGSTGSAANEIAGSLTMTSGTFAILNSNTNSTSLDRRLSVTQQVKVTGGSVTATNGSAQLQMFGTNVSHTFSPTTFDTSKYTLSLHGSGDQSLALGVQGPMLLRGYGVKTLSSTFGGTSLSKLDMVDGDRAVANRGTTLRLASNLSSTAFPSMTNLSTSEVATSRADLGIDANGNTLDLTPNAGVFRPNAVTTGSINSQAYWSLTSSAGTGRIIANGFNFTFTATGTGSNGLDNNAYTSVGPNVILESRAGSGVANTLSTGTTGITIDPTSIFRYSGLATVANPSTLTSTRSIGDVEVTSGALRISSLAGLQAVRVTGGTLDLGSNDLTVTSGSFDGGTTTSGTLTTSGLFTASGGMLIATLAGSGSFTKVGTGTATLSGANSYAGNTEVSAGTLIVTTSAALPGIVDAGRFAVASGATLKVTSGVDTAAVEGMLATGNFAAGSFAEIDTTGGSRTIGAALGGAYALRKSGENLLTLTGSNTYSGGTVIAGGTLQLGEGGSIAGDVSNQGVLAFNREGSLTIEGVISGTGALLQSSTAGVVTLSGANSYTGVTTVNTGTVIVQGDHSAATGGWYLPNTNNPARSVTFSAGSTVATAADKIVQLGLLTSSGSNTSTLNMLGSSTNDGGLVVGRNSVFTIGAGGTWLQTGTMQVSPQGGASATMTVNAGGLFTYAGLQMIQLNAALNNSGNGTVTIAGGTFVTSAGFEQLVSSTQATNGNATLTLSSGGMLRITQEIPSLTTPVASGSGKPLRMTLGSGGGTIDTNGFSTAIGVDVSGGGGLTKAGLGVLTLSGSNTFTGDTIVSAGTLALGAETTLQTSAVDVAASGALSFGSLSAASLAGLKGAGGLVLENSSLAPVALTIGANGSSSSYDGALSGSGELVKAGNGTFTLTGANAHSGGTTIQSGTLQIGTGGTTGSLAGSVTNEGVLRFNRSDAVTFSGPITGAGGVVQFGSGQLQLALGNSYTGGTLVTGSGSLQVSDATQVGSGTITLQTVKANTDTILSLANGVSLPNPIVLAQTSSNRNNITVSSGTAQLAGPITITGTGGGVNVFYNGVLGSTSLIISGNVTAPSSFTGALSFRRNDIFISGTVTMPAGYFDLNSGGTTSITSTGNVWARTVFQASNNVLRIGTTDANATGAFLEFSGNTTGGGFDVNGHEQTVAGITSSSGSIPAPLARIYNNAATDSTLTLAGMTADRSATVALADGTGGGKLALVMNSAGRTQTLASATSSYTGGTTIVAGTIALGHGNGLGGGGPLVVNGGGLDLRGFSPTVGALSGSATGLITSGTAGAATFTVSSASDSTFAGLIENGLGTVGLTKAGSGALTLTAAHTYTGPTNVNGGRLAVNGSLASAVTVGASGEIGGSGSVGALGGAGLVGPGNSPGILTAPSVDPSGGLDFAFEFTQATPNYASPTASDNDLLWLTDTVTPFTGSLTGANTVSIYLTQSAAALSELTGGFFTAAAGDFFASISGATFQYFVQDAAGTFSYNGQAYKTLAQYDPSKSISVSTVGANGGQVMQLVVVPEPGALVLAGVGAAIAAWACRRGKTPL